MSAVIYRNVTGNHFLGQLLNLPLKILRHGPGKTKHEHQPDAQCQGYDTAGDDFVSFGSVLLLFHRSHLQLIAGFDDGLDAGRCAAQLFPEPLDVGVHRTGVAVIVVAPAFDQQLFSAQHHSPVPHQAQKQCVFLGCQGDGHIRNPDLLGRYPDADRACGDQVSAQDISPTSVDQGNEKAA